MQRKIVLETVRMQNIPRNLTVATWRISRESNNVDTESKDKDDHVTGEGARIDKLNSIQTSLIYKIK